MSIEGALHAENDRLRKLLQLEYERLQRIRNVLGGSDELDTEHLAKAVVAERDELLNQDPP